MIWWLLDRPLSRTMTLNNSYENKIDDSRLRPATVASSVGPQASKNWTSLLARAVVVPFAVALDDLQQVVDRLLALCPCC